MKLPEPIKIYVPECNLCDGTGMSLHPEINRPCPICNGTGLNLDGLTQDEINDLKID